MTRRLSQREECRAHLLALEQWKAEDLRCKAELKQYMTDMAAYKAAMNRREPDTDGREVEMERDAAATERCIAALDQIVATIDRRKARLELKLGDNPPRHCTTRRDGPDTPKPAAPATNDRHTSNSGSSAAEGAAPSFRLPPAEELSLQYVLLMFLAGLLVVVLILAYIMGMVLIFSWIDGARGVSVGGLDADFELAVRLLEERVLAVLEEL